MYRLNISRIRILSLPTSVPLSSGLVILSWGATMAWVASTTGQLQDSVYISNKARKLWVLISLLAFLLNRVSGMAGLVIQIEYGRLIHYYTTVSVDGKGLNTIIPNLLKVSEQPFVGFHMPHGSLSVLAAGI